jgi:23S rRNA pseudouridine2605 synthase
MTTLIKYIASSGIVSRRKAAEIIKQGKVTVNQHVVIEPWHEVSDADTVRYAGKIVKPEQEHVYIVLNKPSGYITTTSDEFNRPTVMRLIKTATKKRVNPVGRLDQETTGILLFTNDGELANKLVHPRYAIKKTYGIQLDRPLERVDEEKLLRGIRLKDGAAKIDTIRCTSPKHRRRFLVTIHSGKKRIIRRMFKHLNYEVQKLDRVQFAGIGKKTLLPGGWRHATNAEVATLKSLINPDRKIKKRS